MYFFSVANCLTNVCFLFQQLMVLTVTEFLPEELVLFDILNTLFTDLLIKITFSISVSSLNFNIWLDLNNGLKYEYLE